MATLPQTTTEHLKSTSPALLLWKVVWTPVLATTTQMQTLTMALATFGAVFVQLKQELLFNST